MPKKSKKYQVIALVVAAGRGNRLKANSPKQYLPFAGKPMLAWSLETLLNHPGIDTVKVVIHPDDNTSYKKATAGLNLLSPAFGGKTRQESVYNGLKSLKPLKPLYVLIHDAARPFVSNETISNLLHALKTGKKAAIPAIVVSDTLKKTTRGKITSEIPREGLVAVQTPQVFHYQTILNAHEQNKNKSFTDDAGIATASGITVHTIEGSPENNKITTDKDFTMAEQFLKKQTETRVGMGFDVHAFGKAGKHIMLCGIKVPFARTLEGHSDADVGLHALVDAMLGAMGEGDIGQHFPPSNPKWKGADSSLFVTHAVQLLTKKSAKITNVDLTIICEAPKVVPYRNKMRARIAELLGISKTRVNIKATTTEKLGFLGRGEGIAAQAVVTVIGIV